MTRIPSRSPTANRRTTNAWVRAEINKTRGLNWNFNRTLKQVFKGAATCVIAQHPNDPLHKDYERMIASGIKPNLSKLTLARKIAAIALAMWKHNEVYDPGEVREVVIACLGACIGEFQGHTAHHSHKTPEPSRIRGRASIAVLYEDDRAVTTARAEVPTDRLRPLRKTERSHGTQMP